VDVREGGREAGIGTAAGTVVDMGTGGGCASFIRLRSASNISVFASAIARFDRAILRDVRTDEWDSKRAL